MDKLRILVTLAVISCLSGCIDLLAVNLEDGSLTTDQGEFKVHSWSDHGTAIISPSMLTGPRAEYGFYAYDGINEIAIELTASYKARLYIATEFVDRKSPDITIGPSSYWFNDREAGSLTLASPYRTGALMYVNPGFILRTFEMSLPAELAAHEIRIDGDGVRNSRSIIDDLEGEMYRYAISFKIGERAYTLDLKFRYESYRKIQFGVPATP